MKRLSTLSLTKSEPYGKRVNNMKYTELTKEKQEKILDDLRYEYLDFELTWEKIKKNIAQDYGLDFEVNDYNPDDNSISFVEATYSISNIDLFLQKNKDFFGRQSYLIFQKIGSHYYFPVKARSYRSTFLIEHLSVYDYIHSDTKSEIQYLSECEICGYYKKKEHERTDTSIDYCDCEYPLDIEEINIAKLRECFSKIIEKVSKETYAVFMADFKLLTSDAFLIESLNDFDFEEDGEIN